ncbi:hypothetical protein CR513_57131, partial [Mucuna pruriens]
MAEALQRSKRDTPGLQSKEEEEGAEPSINGNDEERFVQSYPNLSVIKKPRHKLQEGIRVRMLCSDDFSWICLKDFCVTSFCSQRSTVDPINLLLVYVFYASMIISLIRSSIGANPRRSCIGFWNLMAKTGNSKALSWRVHLNFFSVFFVSYNGSCTSFSSFVPSKILVTFSLKVFQRIYLSHCWPRRSTLALEDIPSLLSKDEANLAYQNFTHELGYLIRKRSNINAKIWLFGMLLELTYERTWLEVQSLLHSELHELLPNSKGNSIQRLNSVHKMGCFTVLKYKKKRIDPIAYSKCLNHNEFAPTTHTRSV